MKVVIDPNVLISAVVASGVSAELLDRWLTDRPFDVVVCPTLIGELRAVLARDRFRRWISVRESDLFVTRFEEEAERWADPGNIPGVTGDPKDESWSRSTATAMLTCSSLVTRTCLPSKMSTSACSRLARCSPDSDAARLAGCRSRRRASQPREPTIAEIETPSGRC